MSHQAIIGILGGSGLYTMDELVIKEERTVSTPWGFPSAPLIFGEIEGVPIVFLARHGNQHQYIPSEVPYKANIFALKRCGVRYLLSVSAVGSLQEGFRPQDILIPDQYIDLTKKRESTFFGHGVVAHVSMANPTCPALNTILAQASKDCIADISQTLRVHHGGTYVCIEGPQFSSKAESHWFRNMGADVVGMTNMPESKLAKEAEIAYASLNMITDYDCWHEHKAAVNVESAVAVLQKNVKLSQQILRKAVIEIHTQQPVSESHTALQKALLTPQYNMTSEQQEYVSILQGRY